ncbi:MAG: EipA family protein, partial [Methylocella sp.]
MAASLPAPAVAQTTGSTSKAHQTYTTEEILATGHQFFGKTTRGFAEAVEYVFQSQGEPTAYIVGEEGAGAFIGGLRYGEGTIYYKDGTRQKIYWQGPSVGWD